MVEFMKYYGWKRVAILHQYDLDVISPVLYLFFELVFQLQANKAKLNLLRNDWHYFDTISRKQMGNWGSIGIGV